MYIILAGVAVVIALLRHESAVWRWYHTLPRKEDVFWRLLGVRSICSHAAQGSAGSGRSERRCLSPNATGSRGGDGDEIVAAGEREGPDGGPERSLKGS